MPKPVTARLQLAPVPDLPAAPSATPSATPGASTAPESDIAALVRSCGAGDEQAWAEFVRIFSPLVWTVARSFNLSGADCEDVCQLTWLRVMEHVRTLRQPERVAAWIVTTAKREALRHLMRSTRHVPVGDSAPLEFAPPTAGVATPEETALARIESEQVLAAIRQLSEPHQALLAMLLQDPTPSYDEISHALGIPRGSIGPTRSRIIRRVREYLASADTAD